MTLQASGPITFDDLNAELGQASGATISLNDTRSRNATGTASGAQLGLNNFFGLTYNTAWVNQYTIYSQYSSIIGGVGRDGSGNIYIAVSDSGGFGDTEMMAMAKFNKYGVLQWQKKLQWSGATYSFGSAYDLVTDSSGNSYIVGCTNGGGGGIGVGRSIAVVMKIDTSGSVLWVKGFTGTGNSVFRNVIINSAQTYLYIAGKWGDNVDQMVAKCAVSDGTFQWIRVLDGFVDDVAGVAVDSADSVYLGGQTQPNGGNYDTTLVKFNSSGTVQWQRSLVTTQDEYFGMGVAVDNSNNVYAYSGAPGSSASTMQCVLLKYNTAGTLQWQVAMGAGSVPTCIDVDTSGNIYVSGYSASGITTWIAKFNSSGTLQWERRISQYAGTDSLIPCSITIDGINMILLISSGSGNRNVIRLPIDGTLAGNYSPIIYGTSSFGAATSTFSTGTPSFTITTPSPTYFTIAVTPTTINKTNLVSLIK